MSQLIFIGLLRKNEALKDLARLHHGLLSLRHVRNGYVNSHRNIVGCLRQTDRSHGSSLCTYNRVSHLRREVAAIGHILAKLDVSIHSRQGGQRWYSTGNKEENEDDNQRHRQIKFIDVGLKLLWAITALALLIDANKVRLQTATLDDFFNQFLLKGRVQGMYVERPFGVVYARVMTLDGFDVWYRIKSPEYEVKRRLSDFEIQYNVPQSERIPFTSFFNPSITMLFWSSLITALMLRRKAHLMQLLEKGKPFDAAKAATQARPRKDAEEVKRPKPDEKPEVFDEQEKDLFNMFFNTGATVKRGDRIHKDKLSFKDVAGLKEAKVEIMEFVDYIKQPENFVAIGAKPPRGALLLGPPGCGKTLLAKALAAECDVPFFYSAGSEFIEIIGGVGAARVRSLFRTARKEAPCIIYIDEIDAVGGKRAGTDRMNMSNDENDQTLNQLLTEMDGMKSTQGVIVLASTNRPDTLDTALLRPGRFDRHIMIDYPTLMERIELFELYLGKLRLKGPVSTYATRLAQLTPGKSGADIANICNEGAMHAAREGKDEVTAADLDYAVDMMISGKAKKTNTLSEGDRKVIAYYESGRVLVGWLLEHTDALLKVSIVPRTSNILGFASYTPKETKIFTSDQLFDEMCMKLGGVAAENVIFNKTSSGAEKDLRVVTDMAYKKVKNYGMSKSFGLVTFPADSDGSEFAPKPFSKKLGAQLDQEARQLVSKAYARAEKLLRENEEKLRQLAAKLIEKETLQFSEVEQILGPSPYGRKHVVDPESFFDEELKLAESEQKNAKNSKSAKDSSQES